MARQRIPGVGAHARDRVAERLGRDLTRDEWLAAVEAITGGRAVRLAVTDGGAEHYLHELGGVRLRLVWRPDLAMIVTVLPAEWTVDKQSAKTKAGPVRRTLHVCAKFKGGKRLPSRTCWVPPEDRG